MRRQPIRLLASIVFVFLLVFPAKTDVAALGRAHALFAQGDLDAAMSETQAAKQAISPETPEFAGLMARALWQEAQILRAMGDLSGALERAEESVEHASRVGSDASIVTAIYQSERGKISLDSGILEYAEEDFTTALSVLDTAGGFEEIRFDVRRHLALTLSERGDITAAHDHFDALVEARRAQGSDPALASALIDLAGTKLRLDTDGLLAADQAEALVSEAELLISRQDRTMQGELVVLRGRIALQRSDLSRAEVFFSEAVELFANPLQTAHAQLLEAQVNMLRGRSLRAERLYMSALQDIERRIGKQHPIVARTLVGLGLVTSDLGRPSDAISYLSRAVRVFEDSAGIGTTPAAEARVELAMIFNGVGEYESARSVAETALETLSESVSDLRVAYAHSALGFAFSGLGENEPAIDHLETAVRDISRLRGPQSSDLVPGLIRLASIKTSLGGQWYVDAADNLSTAFRIIEKDNASGARLVAAAREVEIRLLSRSDQPQEAAAHAREALTYLRSEMRPSSQACDVRASEVKARNRLLTTAVDTLAAVEKFDTELANELLEAAQLAHMGAASNALLAKAGMRKKDERSQQLLLERAQYMTEYCVLTRELLLGISGAVRGVEIDREAVGLRLADLMERIADLDTEIGTGDLTPTDQSTPVSVQRITKHLRDGEGMLLQLTGADQSHLFWIDASGLSYRKTDLSSMELAQSVQRIRQAIEIANAGPDEELPAFPLDAAHMLYTKIFEPFEEEIARTTNVFFIADGAARSIPVSILLTETPVKHAMSDPETLAALPWFGAEHAFAVLPSPASLIALRESAATPGSLAFVGIGNPKFARESYALPETEEELNKLGAEIAGPKKPLVVVGQQATENFVRTSASVRDARVLAFATHGLLNRELGTTEPALMLTPAANPDENAAGDGFLTASEIATLDLKADWVILSACNTAAGRDDRAEGLSGLASGFFQAGARSLLVSHWYVPSAAAAALTVFTAEVLAKDAVSRPEALRQAMDRVREGYTLEGIRNARFGHPAYWAPFVVVGDTG